MKTSFLMMGTGTIIVLFFSDAMVNILNELGVRTGIASPRNAIPSHLAG